MRKLRALLLLAMVFIVGCSADDKYAGELYDGALFMQERVEYKHQGVLFACWRESVEEHPDYSGRDLVHVTIRPAE